MEKKLRLYYQNFRGMKTKLRDIHLETIKNNFDVIVGTETWLDDSIEDNELFTKNYNIYRLMADGAEKFSNGDHISASAAWDDQPQDGQMTSFKWQEDAGRWRLVD